MKENFLKNPDLVHELSIVMDAVFSVLPILIFMVIVWLVIEFMVSEHPKVRILYRKLFIISLAVFGYTILLNWCFRFYVPSLGPEDTFTTIEWIKIFAIVLLPLIPIIHRMYLFGKTNRLW